MKLKIGPSLSWRFNAEDAKLYDIINAQCNKKCLDVRKMIRLFILPYRRHPQLNAIDHATKRTKYVATFNEPFNIISNLISDFTLRMSLCLGTFSIFGSLSSLEILTA